MDASSSARAPYLVVLRPERFLGHPRRALWLAIGVLLVFVVLVLLVPTGPLSGFDVMAGAILGAGVAVAVFATVQIVADRRAVAGRPSRPRHSRSRAQA